MKISCCCGNLIYDSTDYIANKAYLVADQDFFDLLDGIDENVERLAKAVREPSASSDLVAKQVDQAAMRIRGLMSKYCNRTLYQCAECGRLYVDTVARDLRAFVPGEGEEWRGLLGSIEGARWRRPLRGYWKGWSSSDDKGELWWGFGGDDEGFEVFQDWERLQDRYHEVFARLQAKGILRGAFLTRDGETVHEWPPRT